MAINKKEIRDFNLNPNPDDGTQFVIQTQAGVTQKTTKSAILADTNAAILGLQYQLEDLIGVSGVYDLRISELETFTTNISSGDAIIMPRHDDNFFTESSLVVYSGGDVQWYGGNIYIGNTLGVRAGGTMTIHSSNAVLLNTDPNVEK